MAYWRDVEDCMLSNLSLEEEAAEQGAPFIRDPVADYLSAELLPRITEQATAAGGRMVAPVLEVDPRLVMEGVELGRIVRPS